MQQISLRNKTYNQKQSVKKMFIQTNTFFVQKGFSLIEILIAVSIMVTSLIFILPQIGRSENKIKKSLRHLQALNRTLYSYAKINNRTYRLAFDMSPKNPRYWVEVKKTIKEKEIESHKAEENTNSYLESLKEKKEIPHPFFTRDQKLLKKEKKLPSRLYFQTSHPTEDESEKKILYITYNPHSFSESVDLIIKHSEGKEWILQFHPILGELEIAESQQIKEGI